VACSYCRETQEEITAALTEYNQHIEDLKREMDAATQSAEAIRRDIRDLRSKYAPTASSANAYTPESFN